MCILYFIYYKIQPFVKIIVNIKDFLKIILTNFFSFFCCKQFKIFKFVADFKKQNQLDGLNVTY